MNRTVPTATKSEIDIKLNALVSIIVKKYDNQKMFELFQKNLFKKR
jgi:hypothetical protein